MVDKIWYDWQQKGPRNKYSYGGGSAQGMKDFKTFVQFPTGLPPYLNVSASSELVSSRSLILFVLLFQFDSDIPGDNLWNNVTIWDVMDTTGDTLCYTYA